MLYKNYKQVAIIHLNSIDADNTQNGVQAPLTFKTEIPEELGDPPAPTGHIVLNEYQPVQRNTRFFTEYTFNVNIPYKFTKTTKMSLVSFNIKYDKQWMEYNSKAANVGGLYIKNLHKSNVYHKNKSNGLLLMNEFFGNDVDYHNQDIINNSIDITNNTSFLEGNQIKVFLDAKIFDDNDNLVVGCIGNVEWCAKLYIFEEELVENKPDSVDDRTVNYSRPAIY